MKAIAGLFILSLLTACGGGGSSHTSIPPAKVIITTDIAGTYTATPHSNSPMYDGPYHSWEVYSVEIDDRGLVTGLEAPFQLTQALSDGTYRGYRQNHGYQERMDVDLRPSRANWRITLVLEGSGGNTIWFDMVLVAAAG